MGGEIPTDWPMLPLEDVMEAIIDYRGKTPKKSTSGIPLITAKIVKAGRIEAPTEFIAEDLFDDWMIRGLPKRGDVVLTTEAPLGEVAQLSSDNVALAQRIVTLRGKSGLLDNDFLLYLMQSDMIQHQLQARSSGSTVKGIKQSELRKILLPVPPYLEQVFIGKVLKSLDDKIELNMTINRTLEAMAQAIFKSWFVDFDPVKAKMAARESGDDPTRAAMAVISGKTDAELDAFQQQDPKNYQRLHDTAQAFPDALVESELGMIPEGWGVQRVQDVLTLEYGKSLSKTSRKEGDVPVYGSGGITGTHNSSLVKGPGVIVGRKGTVGSLYWEDRDFFPIDTVFYVVPKAPVSLEFCHYLLQTLGLTQMNTDAAVPGLNRNNVYRIEVPVAPSDVIHLYTRVVATLRLKVKSNIKEIERLTDARDLLLPRLLAGHLD